MVKRRRARVLLFGALALVAALLPAGLAAGSHDGSAAIGPASVVYLTLGGTDRVTWEGESQSIGIRNNNCSVTFAPTLLDIIPTGGELGAVKDGLGVKSRMDGTGEPCGRVEADDDEKISVALGDDLDGYLMSAIDVDLELKFNASVIVNFYHGEGDPIHTDTFDPTTGSDDGPDSADGDNWRYFERPMNGDDPILFDRVEFVPDTGSLSLEGGADGVENGVIDEENNSSQFEVVQTFDGDITCNDTERIEDEAVPGVLGEVTMFAMEFVPEGSELPDWHIQNCLLKPFNESVSEDSVFFMPELAETTGRYTIRITVEDQVVETDANGQIISLIMLYDPEGDSEPTLPLQPCEGQPILVDDPEDDPDAYADFWTGASVELLPGTQTACYYDVSLMPTGPGVGTEVWDIYFEDDPGFSFR